MRLPDRLRDGKREIDFEELEAMVDLFLERGFTYFDTAYTYHDGRCEEALRKTLTERYPRERYTLTDKLPTLLLENEEQQKRIFEGQLERCGVSRFDRYLVHCATEAFYEKALRFRSFEFVLGLREQGLVGQAGFSFHGSPELLEEILRRYPEVDFVQLQISYLDWEHSPIRARNCYEIARRRGKPVVAMCPLKGGLLSRPPKTVEQLLRSFRPELPPAAWALRYVAGLEGVETVLSGMSSLEQMRGNIACLEHFDRLNEQELDTLREAAALTARLTPIQCTGCGYCLPVCPEQIPIPTDLWLLNENFAAGSADIGKRCKTYIDLSHGLGRASDCIACRRCEAACPQHIDIVEWLKQAVAAFECTPQPA